jgi:glutamate synthase domain-containing protein 3
MPATIVSSSAAASVVFGCTAETGILINSFSRQVSREKAEIMDNDGDVVAVSYFKPTATISIEGSINGTTGVMAAAPGVALTINSTTSGNGITGGTIIVDSATRSEESEGFSTFSVEATQYPSI